MRPQQAFTQLELLITLSIIAILLAFSLPGLTSFLSRNNDQIIQSEILRAIQFARQEAHARGVPVSLCGSKDHKTCSAEWSDSLLIFTDENEDGIIRNNQQLLSVNQIHTNQGKLHLRSYPSYRTHLLFNPTGLLTSDDGTFWYCRNAQQTPAWAIAISKTGRTRVRYPGDFKAGPERTLRC